MKGVLLGKDKECVYNEEGAGWLEYDKEYESTGGTIIVNICGTPTNAWFININIKILFFGVAWEKYICQVTVMLINERINVRFDLSKKRKLNWALFWKETGGVFSGD